MLHPKPHTPNPKPRAEQRRRRAPQPTFDDALPIAAQRAEIAAAIAANQVLVVCGATGSGKSTQLPKICLAAGRGLAGFIGHTQPRRIAARALAARIADELGSPLGRDVGYKIRFTDTTRPDCFIKLMTDGILLAETRSDPLLRRYDTLIIDEAHERSLNIDFLLGYLKQLLPRRPDLKLLITSATIDPQRFADHFAHAGRPAPIIEVTGRTYPVETLYKPLDADPDTGEAADLPAAIASTIDELADLQDGDVLVFLPTERDILETAKALRGRTTNAAPGSLWATTEILPLYSRLPTNEQDRVFQRHAGRRIVLATNVAETSLTVPNISFVIDPGSARISRYSARAGVQRLPIEPISRASADQRKGRCGRVRPGLCVRLYSEEDFNSREAFTPPEILRTNLAQVILQMADLRLGDVARFPFLDPPRPSAIREGYRTLFELGAIDDRQRLTPVGRQLARLPLDPRLGRMLLAADAEGCLADVLIIVAGLSVQDPRLRPPEKQQAADEAHKQFHHPRSDFLTLLNIWDAYHNWLRELSRNHVRATCQKHFLSPLRLREWLDVHRQIRELLQEAGYKINSRGAPQNNIHRALLAGLLSNIAQLGDENTYTGADAKNLTLWPGSVIFRGKPKWIVAAELVETTRLFARTAAAIDPDWLEPLAQHLVHRSYSDPHWDRATARVLAFEKVTLFGLTIVARRRSDFSRADPAAARTLFIQHALVEQDFDCRAPFFRHNAELIDQVRTLQNKARRTNILADEAARFAFYDSRLPADVCSGSTLDKWLRSIQRRDPRALHMRVSDVLARPADDVTPDSHPDTLRTGDLALPLTYALAPGSPADGLTVTLPAAALSQLQPQRLGWLVGGMLLEKVTTLIRSLPKDLRRGLGPAPDAAQRALALMQFGEGSLPGALSRALTTLAGYLIPPDVLSEDTLPAHLRMNLRVVGDHGETLAEGRDLAALRAAVTQSATPDFSKVEGGKYNRDGLRGWTFGPLPPEVPITHRGFVFRGYPTLIDAGDSVSLRLLDRPNQSRPGLRRLFALQVHNVVASAVDYLPDLETMLLHHTPLGPTRDLKAQLADLIVDRAFLFDDPDIRTPEAFHDRLELGWHRIENASAEVARVVRATLAAHHAASLALASLAPRVDRDYALADIRQQLSRLVPTGFLTTTPWQILRHFPRYLTAIERRLTKLSRSPTNRDRDATQQLADFTSRYDALAARDPHHPHLPAFRWLLEELRVHLFAQELGTPHPVSPKRLETFWQKNLSGNP